jgi:chemosensory pili system protein ChpA (sensor histidine kinase/response regulator)
VVKRNRIEEEQERCVLLDNLLNQVQNLSDVGSWHAGFYERTLLEGALLASRNSSGAIGYGRVKGENQGDSAMTGELDALEIRPFYRFPFIIPRDDRIDRPRWAENRPLIFNLSSMKPIG